MITFEFNGLSFADEMRVNEIKGRGLTPSDVSTIKVPGMVGVHAARKTRLPRMIEIKFTIIGNSLTDLRNKINKLSGRLDLDETAPLVFSDEPDKTYYAIMVNATDDDEIKTYGFGSFVFMCPDPYKYGPEQTVTLNTETGTIVNVAGTAPTKPIIELTASAPSTYVLVANDRDEYTMMGQMGDVDSTPYTRLERVLTHDMQNLTNWTPAGVNELDYPVTGTMQTELVNNKRYFSASSFGTGPDFHGPAVKRSFPAPLMDFRVQAEVRFMNSANKNMMGNLEMYLLDVNNKIIARIGLRDGYVRNTLVYGLAHLGQRGTAPRREITNTYGDRKGVWNDFAGVLRLEREGTKWTAYFAKVNGKGEHHTRSSRMVWDSKGNHATAVTQVVFAIQQYGTANPVSMRVGSVKVDKINKLDNGISYIVAAGDTVTFDHTDKEHGYRINGEPVPEYKDFGATQFELQPGANTLVIEPGGSFTGTIRWRDAYK